MTVWKILGGAAVGVAAVVAGTVSNYFSKAIQNQKLENAKNEGRNEAKPEYDAMLKDIFLKMNNLNEYAKIGKFIVDNIAVGFSAAFADGKFNEKEKIEIESMIQEINQSNLNDIIKSDIELLYKNPPNLNTIWERVKNDSIEKLELFEKTILQVLAVDNELNELEKAYFQAWTKLKNDKINNIV